MREYILILVLCGVFSPALAQPDTWQQRSDVGWNAPNGPIGRNAAVCFSIGNNGYFGTGNVLAARAISVREALIRHAYVRTAKRNSGIGGKLLAHLRSMAETRILIGTWADAKWAIAFYEKHGFRLVSEQEKNTLLRRYWNIPERQVETSVVLTSSNSAGI